MAPLRRGRGCLWALDERELIHPQPGVRVERHGGRLPLGGNRESTFFRGHLTTLDAQRRLWPALSYVDGLAIHHDANLDGHSVWLPRVRFGGGGPPPPW